MSKFSPPSWAKTAVATDRGWEDPRTGELLVSRRNLKSAIEKLSGSVVVTAAATAPLAPLKVSEVAVRELTQEPAVEKADHREQKNHFSKSPNSPDFGNMSKEELEVWARENIELELDRRKTKKSLIKEIKEKIK